MNRGKKFYLILGTIVLNAVTFALSTTFITFSWFNKGFDIEFNKQTGTSEANYFASGDGTRDNPYKITTPRHYYNFAWLQYLGEFNKTIKKDNIDVIDQKYFVLANDIDMNEYVVPPVGTSEYAFVGNFNGGGYVVNNLKVSNNFADFGARHPSVVNETSFNVKNINILGTFGVVGNDEVNREDRTKYYYYNVNAIDTPINCIQNLYLDNVTITSTSNQLLIGIIAGYADGVIKTCGVHYATFDINGATSHISDDGLFAKNEKISNYTLLGAYNTNRFYWDGKPGFEGVDASWGDSISMITLYRRIAYMAGSSNFKDFYDLRKIDGYPLALRIPINSSTIPYYNTVYSTIPYVSLYKDTYLPLSIDTSKAFDAEFTDYDTEHITTKFYSKKSKEIVLDSNSGYFVGGKGNNPGAAMRIEPQRIGLKNSYISLNDVGEVYDGNKLNFWSIDTTSSNLVEEKIYEADTNKFVKFNEVKEKFDLSMEGMKTINGFHFFGEFNKDKRTTVNDGSIKINRNTYNSYEFIDSSLNFTVKNPGYVTTINGSYYYGDRNQTLFDLFYVEREYNIEQKKATVKNARKINQIYKDNANGIKYVFSDGSYLTYSGFSENNKKLVFDFSKVTDSNHPKMTPYKAFYYEMPVMPGDYAIGKESGLDNAYIMYLDIGADSKADDKSGEALEYIDFVSKDANGIQKMDANYVTSKIGFKISDIDESASFNFRRLGNIVYFYTVDNNYKFISQALAIPDGFQIKQAKTKDCNTAK